MLGLLPRKSAYTDTIIGCSFTEADFGNVKVHFSNLSFKSLCVKQMSYSVLDKAYDL